MYCYAIWSEKRLDEKKLPNFHLEKIKFTTLFRLIWLDERLSSRSFHSVSEEARDRASVKRSSKNKMLFRSQKGICKVIQRSF